MTTNELAERAAPALSGATDTAAVDVAALRDEADPSGGRSWRVEQAGELLEELRGRVHDGCTSEGGDGVDDTDPGLSASTSSASASASAASAVPGAGGLR